MKRNLIAVLVVSGMLMASQVSAGEVADGMGDRFQRGVKNFFTSIIEFPMQIKKGYNNGVSFIENEAGSKTVGTVLGIFRGVSHWGGRMSSGAIELFGFWAVSPEDNDGVGIPLDHEDAWEDGTQYSLFEPSFEEGIKPIGRKIGRGFGNGLLGILELPGQIKKGADEGNVVKGVGKGFWYWMSRGVYGMKDLTSALAPNPVDNKGVHFEEEWPWDALSE